MSGRKNSLGKALNSIIIVNHNGGLLLRKCVESVFRHTHDFELILVDNDSTDSSDATITTLFPQIVVVKNSRNLGFARANNMGIQRARGENIVLLNPDTVVTPHWLELLSDCQRSSHDIGIAVPKLLRTDGTTIDAAGHTYNFRTGYTITKGSGETDHGQYNAVQEVLTCCFACALVKRKVFEEVGLLDEKMIMYFEDVDFCLRARVAGWRVLYCPRSVVYHRRGGLTTTRSPTLKRNSTAYRLRIILKCYDTRDVLKYGAERILRDILSMGAGVRNNDLDYFLAYLRSPIWNLLNLPIKERWLVQSRRRASDREIAALSPPASSGQEVKIE